MRSKFTIRELNTITKYVVKCSNFMTMRVNKCGNIDFDLRYCNAAGYAHFVLYKYDTGFKIRRRVYCEDTDVAGKWFGKGTYLNNNKPFATINDAMDYFERYIAKRKDSIFAFQTYFA